MVIVSFGDVVKVANIRDDLEADAWFDEVCLSCGAPADSVAMVTETGRAVMPEDTLRSLGLGVGASLKLVLATSSLEA